MSFSSTDRSIILLGIIVILAMLLMQASAGSQHTSASPPTATTSQSDLQLEIPTDANDNENAPEQSGDSDGYDDSEATTTTAATTTPTDDSTVATSTTTESTNQTAATTTSTALAEATDEMRSATYIKVVDACGPYYEEDCLNVRSAPSTEADIVHQLRNGIVLKVDEVVEGDGRTWYKTIFDEWLRHPDRVEGDWYVAAEFVQPVSAAALKEPEAANEGSEKRIVVDLSEQKLYAYEGEEVFMEEPVSTGEIGAVTPRGTFTVFHRTPSRYMQGPIPDITDDEYDLPGVPWNLYFTQQGAVIHGAYWHDHFGTNWSHGCVNLPPEKAQKLYRWTPEGTEVVVQN